MTLRGRRWIIGGVAAIAAMVAAVYYAVDPSQSGWMPKCVFHTITGFDCPGCGSQRMIHALLNGNIREAWSFNPMLFFMLPVIAIFLFLEFFPGRFPRLYRIFNSTPMIAAIGLGIVAWWIIRNLP